MADSLYKISIDWLIKWPPPGIGLGRKLTSYSTGQHRHEHRGKKISRILSRNRFGNYSSEERSNFPGSQMKEILRPISLLEISEGVC